MSGGEEGYEPDIDRPESSEEDSDELMDIMQADEPRDAEEAAIVLRPEAVAGVVKRLSADAQRGEGCLQRSDINRVFLRKKLSFAECIAVEEELTAAGYRVNDDEDEDDKPGPKISGLGNKAQYLTEADERDLGRKIQLALALPDDTDGLDPVYVDRLRREAEKAKSKFVMTNMRYVARLANRLPPCKHLSLEDLMQEGVIGLMRAADLYDPERGFRFKTYATWWIEQRMRRAISDGDRTVRLPVHLQEKMVRIRRAETKLALVLGRQPTPDELATAVGLEPDRLMKLLWRVQATDCVEGDSPVGDETTLFELVEDPSGTPLDKALDHELEERIRHVLASLTPREERILRMRFGIGLDSDHTLDSIGRQYGITRERIRQVEAKALGRLRHPTRRRRLQGFLD